MPEGPRESFFAALVALLGVAAVVAGYLRCRYHRLRPAGDSREAVLDDIARAVRLIAAESGRLRWLSLVAGGAAAWYFAYLSRDNATVDPTGRNRFVLGFAALIFAGNGALMLIPFVVRLLVLQFLRLPDRLCWLPRPVGVAAGDLLRSAEPPVPEGALPKLKAIPDDTRTAPPPANDSANDPAGHPRPVPTFIREVRAILSHPALLGFAFVLLRSDWRARWFGGLTRLPVIVPVLMAAYALPWMAIPAIGLVAAVRNEHPFELLFALVYLVLFAAIGFQLLVYAVCWCRQQAVDPDGQRRARVAALLGGGAVGDELNRATARLVVAVVVLVTLSETLADFGVIGRNPTSIAVGSLLTFQLLQLKWFLARPPGVLLLTHSTPRTLGWVAELSASVWYTRIATLLQSRQLDADQAVREAMLLDTFRLSGEDWEARVAELARLVPVVILEGRQVTEPLVAELKIVVHPEVLSKTLVVTDGTTCPLVAEGVRRGIVAAGTPFQTLRADAVGPALRALGHNSPDEWYAIPFKPYLA